MKQKTVTTNKAVLYARVSSKEQEREGYSIPAQKKLLASYAQKYGYEIVREFIDVETAKQSGRTHFNEMVQYLEEHQKVSTILCEKTRKVFRSRSRSTRPPTTTTSSRGSGSSRSPGMRMNFIRARTNLNGPS